MGDSKKKDRGVTFRPDDDVWELLKAVKAQFGDLRVRSTMINDALRSELPAVLAKWAKKVSSPSPPQVQVRQKRKR